MSYQHTHVHTTFALFLFCLPWLNPFAPGPSPSVGPWLFSAAAFSGVLLVVALRKSAQLKSLTALHIELTRAFGWSLLAAGLISCVLALLQYFGVGTVFAPWVNATEPGQAFANLRQRNQFATLTNLALAALLWLAMQVQQQQEGAEKYGHMGLQLAGVSLLAVGNAISSSRTGLFQLLLLYGLYVVWGGLRSRTIQRLLLSSVLVYAIAMFAMPYLAGLDVATHGAFARLGKNEACSSRLTLWSNVLHLMAQKPWLGWGWGELDFAHFITLYNGPRFCDILDNAHNLPLHLAVELGVPAAVLVCGGFTWWTLRLKPWAERDADRQLAWAVIAVILLHSMLEYPLWYGPFQMAFGLCVLFLVVGSKKRINNRNGQKIRSKRAVALVLRAQAAILLIAIALLSFSLYAAWDYRRISQIYLQPEARDAFYRSDTLAKIRSSWLFADQVRFAELMITPLTQSNADWTFNTANALLHYSPEPRVVEKLIESAVMLGRDDEALAHLARYRAAFPKDHALWAKAIATAKPN